MKKYFQKLSPFILGVLAINILVTFVVDGLYYEPYTRMIRQIDNEKLRGVIMADSHGLPLKQNLKDQGIVNVSWGSDSYEDMRNKLQFYLKEKQLDYVLISADNHLLSNYRENLNNIEASINYVPFTESVYGFWEYSYLKYIKRYFSLVSPKNRDIFLARLKSFLKSNLVSKEWKDVGNKVAKGEKRVDLHFSALQKSERLAIDLESMIALCKANGVQVIGVKYPLTSAYLSAMESSNFGADSVLRANDCKILDFQEVFANRNDLFSDEDHLNKEGGERFAKMLEQNLTNYQASAQ
ncbi:hypothetical protein DN752_02270 [Echinicola strongylocentroti]|uniref:SGNH/GDSL hydrolase family protein n=1 Tax=Echinicola strongylocentroti TaxID=1795355 RepID=A0A2Z4IDS9_9BACT|nr:hypothetical protein [Echinicola strongylocentroti]AWW29054.1 hypothetical protein DN752_02270 [Echinicola strongylocentroti]